MNAPEDPPRSAEPDGPRSGREGGRKALGITFDAAFAVTLGVAASGVGVFYLLDLPLPFLLGPMFACLIAALAGVKLRSAGPLSTLMRTVLGTAVGASVTPALIDRVADFAISIALVPPFVMVIGALGYPYFRRIGGFDKTTAYYAAMPGGLQDMIYFGQEAGADVRALSLTHATRVLIIVALMPLLLTTIWGLSLDNPPGEPAATIPPHELALMAACAVIGWRGGVMIGLFGAALLGPMAVTAAASLADIIHYRPPAEAILAAQFFIGLGVGVNYVGVTLTELRRVVFTALGYCAMLAAIAFVFAIAAARLGAGDSVEAFLAFAPGGQAEMTVLAIVAGVDMAYVVTIHLARLVIVIAGAPIAARVLR